MRTLVVLLLTACVARCSEPTTEWRVAGIDKLYLTAHDVKPESMTFDCPDDPISGTLESRLAEGSLRSIRYNIGYEHGSRSLEVLTHNSAIIMVVEGERTWKFDQTPPRDTPAASVEEPTVESGTESRYYFVNSELIFATQRQAEVRSVNGGDLDSALGQAVSATHPDPKATDILQRAQFFSVAYLSGTITADWCGPR